MLNRLISTRGLVLLAVVTLVVPTVVLGVSGMFLDWSTEGGPTFSWGMAAWLVAPYVAFAGLLVWATRSPHVGFRVAVAVTAVVVVASSVVLDALTANSDENLAAVPVLAMPVLFLGGAAVLAVVGLILHVTGRDRAPSGAPGSPLTEHGRTAA